MMRSSVVFPEPDGPSSATSSPVGIFRVDVIERGKLSEFLVIFCASMLMGLLFSVPARRFRQLAPRSPFDTVFTTSVTSASKRQQRRHRERGGELIFVVENLDVQRHGIGESADVAGNHRNRAKLAHRAGIAKNHAIEQPPFDVGQGHAEESLPAAGAERERGFFLFLPLRLQSAESVRARQRER